MMMKVCLILITALLSFSYFENMDRICKSDFVPNSKDVLRVRVRTTGVLETCFKIENVVIRY